MCLIQWLGQIQIHSFGVLMILKCKNQSIIFFYYFVPRANPRKEFKYVIEHFVWRGSRREETE
jgi:hypothetical protein